MGLHDKLFALGYDRFMASTEKAGLGEIRSRLITAATGDVLEVGAGTGRNLTYYSTAVRTITLTEPDPSMVRRLERAAVHDRGRTTVLRAPAEDLPFDDSTFDAVISTLVLCSVSDQPRAAREIKRVLRPGGQLLFVEHVRSHDERLARKQDRRNWVSRLVSRCDCNRSTLRTLQRAGFVVHDLDEGELPKSPSFVRPLVVGTATRPVEVGITMSESGSPTAGDLRWLLPT